MTKYYQDTFRCNECFRLGWIKEIPEQDVCVSCVAEYKENMTKSGASSSVLQKITDSLTGIFVTTQTN